MIMVVSNTRRALIMGTIDQLKLIQHQAIAISIPIGTTRSLEGFLNTPEIHIVANNSTV